MVEGRIRRARRSAAAAILLAAPALTAAESQGGADAPPDPPDAHQTAPAEGPRVDVRRFEGPQRRDVKTPEYPRPRQLQSREGWVQLNFMVDREGRPYAIAVTDSTGDQQFEQAALRALERSSFEPATLDGQPIDSGYGLKYYFALNHGEDHAPGAGRAFVADYRRVMDAIEAGEQEEAQRRLEALDVRNLYEDAFLNLARYNYLALWGEPAEQLRALKRAIAHERQHKYLPAEAFRWALRQKFALQAELQDFGGALDTWEALREQELEPEARHAVEQAVAMIETLRSDDRAYSVDGEILRGKSWYFDLLKRRFRIDRVEGRVTALKLRCERDYLVVNHQPDLVYRVSEEAGPCQLEVVGETGTSFRLVQS